MPTSRMAPISDLYKNKLILAPMVRVGTVPMRLLALKMGADLVYSEEMIDRRIIGTHRTVNRQLLVGWGPGLTPKPIGSVVVDALGTVDYVHPTTGKVAFRTHPMERDRLVFQIGTADADLAVQAALTVHVDPMPGRVGWLIKEPSQQDVAAIDVNCGCPKHFSIHGGMGAALMKNPERLEKVGSMMKWPALCRMVLEVQILGALILACSVPVSCKVPCRIFPDLPRTLEWVTRLERTGISAIAVHCRTVQERPKDPGHWDFFRPIVEALSIPVIVNGDVFTRGDIQRIRSMSGASSVMIARGAQMDPSIFRSNGSIPILDLVRDYVRLAAATGMPYQNAKYTLCTMWPNMKDYPGSALHGAKSLQDICIAFGVAADGPDNEVTGPGFDDPDGCPYIPDRPSVSALQPHGEQDTMLKIE